MPRVLAGIDRVVAGDVRLPAGARIALLSNMAARTVEGVWTGDALRASGCNITLLLTPEHGLAVEAAAGEAVAHGTYANLPVLSMYGGDESRLAGALADVGSLLIDLPDVGCRYYTYPWTVLEALKLAARHQTLVIVLDRPNPLGGRIEGSLPDAGIYVPVCASRVPVLHGLTLAELTLWNRETYAIAADVEVVPCAGWRRELRWPAFELSWVPPSPALPHFASVALYPGTCLFEGTNLSEGRGTGSPFTRIGAPFVDGAALAAELSGHRFLAGIDVRPLTFTPRTGAWAERTCGGVELSVQDQDRARPVRAGLALVEAAMHTPGFAFVARHFDALAGTPRWRQQLETGVPAIEIAGEWQEQEARFARERRSIERY